MGIPYGLILDVVTIFLVVAAFLNADDDRLRVALGVALALILLLPQVVFMAPLSAGWWVFYLSKLFCAIACGVYLKLKA